MIKVKLMKQQALVIRPEVKLMQDNLKVKNQQKVRLEPNNKKKLLNLMKSNKRLFNTISLVEDAIMLDKDVKAGHQRVSKGAKFI